MRKISALLTAVAAISALLAGCEPGAREHVNSARDLISLIAARVGTAGGAPSLPGSPVRYRNTGYGPAIYNPGTTNGFAVFTTNTREITVQPSSAANVRVISNGKPEFITAVDLARWEAAGRPTLDSGPVAGQVISIPPGQFSFVPQIRTLTYQQASSLPATPDGVFAAVLAHSKSGAGDPPATLLLRQFGFLLAVAPLPRATRPAAWDALTKLPGLRLCGDATDLAGRHGDGLCVDSGTDEIKILVDAGTSSVLAVQRRIMQPSASYPGLPAGTTIELDTFIAD